MTRVRLSAAILLIMIAFSTFTCVWMNHCCDDMLGDINKICILAEKGEIDALPEGARELGKKWEHFINTASVLLKYDKLIEIDRIIARIIQLAEKDGDELKAEISEFRKLLEMLKKGETPLITSVF
ncbi:DUF4363 family protein [Ruminococcus sp.]|uniref:DUF4363 family protein n=1 Tax=Ruminococcus sp. TaxID=41978 RepID=UPI0025D0D24E|nr:DUF4363 family protein [Ruminococcus sp.]